MPKTKENSDLHSRSLVYICSRTVVSHQCGFLFSIPKLTGANTDHLDAPVALVALKLAKIAFKLYFFPHLMAGNSELWSVTDYVVFHYSSPSSHSKGQKTRNFCNILFESMKGGALAFWHCHFIQILLCMFWLYFMKASPFLLVVHSEQSQDNR